MSSGLSILAPSEEDIRRMIAAKVHIGDNNHDHRMGQYIHGVSTDPNRMYSHLPYFYSVTRPRIILSTSVKLGRN